MVSVVVFDPRNAGFYANLLAETLIGKGYSRIEVLSARNHIGTAKATDKDRAVYASAQAAYGELGIKPHEGIKKLILAKMFKNLA